jgi:hypothetical protein
LTVSKITKIFFASRNYLALIVSDLHFENSLLKNRPLRRFWPPSSVSKFATNLSAPTSKNTSSYLWSSIEIFMLAGSICLRAVFFKRGLGRNFAPTLWAYLFPVGTKTRIKNCP